MKQEDKDIRGLLNDRMNNFSQEPPAEVWGAVQTEISGKRSRRPLFFMLSAAAGIALAIGIGVPFILSDKNDVNNSDQRQIIADSESKPAIEVPGKDTEEKPLQQVEESSGSIHSLDKTGNTEPSKIVKSSKMPEVAFLAGQKLEDKVLETMREIITEDQQPAIAINQPMSVVSSVQPGVTESDSLKVFEIQNLPISNEDSLLQLLHQSTGPSPEIIEQDEQQRWSVGAALSPLYSYRDVSAAETYRNTVVNKTESAKLTYTGGMSVGYRQSEKLSFESGIYYSRMGVNIGDRSAKNKLFSPVSEDYFESNSEVMIVSNSMGTISSQNDNVAVSNYGNEIVRTDGEVGLSGGLMDGVFPMDLIAQTMEYVEVPFRIRYLVYDKSFQLQLTGGISTNFLVGSSAEIETGDGTLDLGKIRDLQSINYSGNAGLGFVYAFDNNVSLLLEPSFRYYLNSVNLSSLPATRPYAFGLFTGLNFAF